MVLFLDCQMTQLQKKPRHRHKGKQICLLPVELKLNFVRSKLENEADRVDGINHVNRRLSGTKISNQDVKLRQGLKSSVFLDA